MDWIKILFCFCLVISHAVSLKTSNSGKETNLKEGKISSNHTSTNITQNQDEILEGSPSETIRFHKPIIFRERKKVSSVDEDKAKVTSVKKERKQEIKAEDKDLKKEANGYSAVLAFTERPGSILTGSIVPDLWQVVPEIFPYVKQGEFMSPIPIIESQSFVNKPKMSSVQVNYSPPGNVEGRNVHPRSREYPDDHSGYSSEASHEPPPHPGRGHNVHTETIHDYGRFLPVTYKSQIEQEAEALIKRKKAQNTTTEGPQQYSNDKRSQQYYNNDNRPQQYYNNDNRPQQYYNNDNRPQQYYNNDNRPQQYYNNNKRPQQYSGKRPQQYNKDKQQRITSYRPRYQRPVNTAFFHKGHFEDAYPFPNGYEDQRYTSEEYPKQKYTTEPKEPGTSTAVGETYGPRQPVTSTETYKPQYTEAYQPEYTKTYQPQYSYSSEKYPSSYHAGSQHKDPHPIEPHHGDANLRGQHPKDPPYREPYHGDGNYRGQHYNKEPHYENANYRGHHHKDPHYREPHYGDANHSGQQHQNLYNKKPHHEDSSHTAHHGDSYYRDPNHKDSPHTGQVHVDSYHRGPHYTDIPNVSPPNAPRQYDSSTEKYIPPHSDSYEKPLSGYPGTTQAPQQYSQPVDQPPLQYPHEKKALPPSYSTDYHQPNPHTDTLPKEFQVPYSNKPSVESHTEPSVPPSDSMHYTKDSESYDPPIIGPGAKNPLDIVEEKAYYNTFRALFDLYKSFGFQPYNLDEIPIILPPRYSYGNPFHGKIEVSGPTSGSVSADFHSNYKAPVYSSNTQSNGDHSYDNYRSPYSNSNYNSKEHISNFKPTSSVGNQNPHYHEQVPYDSNRSPIVSTEHYDIPETSKPVVSNTQVESPTATHAPPDVESPKGIRIKDYDPKTFYGDPPKKNMYNSAESEFSSSASLPDSPLHTHPVVRQNPYNVQSTHSAEIIPTDRPRIYRQKLKVETIPSSNTDSEERTNNFHTPNMDNSRDVNGDTSKPLEPFSVHNDNLQSQYNLPASEMQRKSQTKNQQRRPRKSKAKQSHKDARFRDEQEYRHNKRKKARRNSEKNQGEFTFNEPESLHPESRPKRKGKRSHRSPKKQKSQRDHMRAEGSTYHWGMERHKGTDGFFQYANVPGAKAFEYGYRMGGPEHTRERHHRTKGIQSKIKVNWEDGNGDSGDHYWEFNHNSKEDDTEEPTPDGTEEHIEKSESASEE